MPSYTFQYWSQISIPIAVDRSTKVLPTTPSDQMIWSRKWKQSPDWLDWLILVITEYNWWRGSSWYLNYRSESGLSHHSKQNRGGHENHLRPVRCCVVFSLINNWLLWYADSWELDIEDDIDTDWSIFSLPVEQYGWELFILPRAPSSLRDDQSGASWRPVICCCCSWPNITALASSLVINITELSLLGRHCSPNNIEVPVCLAFIANIADVNILQSFSLPSPPQSMNEWNKHFVEDSRGAWTVTGWTFVPAQCSGQALSVIKIKSIYEHLWAGKSWMTVNINSNPTNGPRFYKCFQLT